MEVQSQDWSNSLRDSEWNKWAKEDIEYKTIETVIGKKMYRFTIPERTIFKKYYLPEELNFMIK